MALIDKWKAFHGHERRKIDPYVDENQQALIGLLQARARGENSVAEQQVKQGLAQNLQGQQTGIRGMSGINNALRQRMLANSSAKAGSEMAMKGAIARTQEMNSASQSLGDILQGRSVLQADMADKTAENRAASHRAGLQAISSLFGGGGKG